MRILAIGPLWRGSNAGGLFKAISRKGCLIEIVDEFYSISLQTFSKFTKICERIIRPLQVNNYNNIIRKKIDVFQPDIVFVYKGTFVSPEVLIYAKSKGCKLVLFYPDVSVTAHGGNIPKCIPLYDLIFTTKTFGISDMEKAFGVTNTRFLPHGFDPEIHRKLQISEQDRMNFSCDASFIGTWSPKKEKWLGLLKEKCPDINLKIWGNQWDRSSTPILTTSIQGYPVVGDLYAVAIQCSKINLGILSEIVVGASSGDLITSRTFHITGAYGFLLHERNEESVLYYEEDVEAGFFDGPDELAQQVNRFLTDDALRNKIQEAGYKRAQLEYSLDNRAEQVISGMQTLLT